MAQINYEDVKALGFKKEMLNDSIHIAQLGFDDFTMALELSDDFILSWYWNDKTVTLYRNGNITEFKTTILNTLISFINVFKENETIEPYRLRETPLTGIKKTIESQLFKFTDGEHTIYLEKKGEKTIILNKQKREYFTFQDPEISKKICTLIAYAFDNINE
jgi:hypothetical protein